MLSCEGDGFSVRRSGPNPVAVQALALISKPQATLPSVPGRDDKTGLSLSHPAEEITCSRARSVAQNGVCPHMDVAPSVLIQVELGCFRARQHKMDCRSPVFDKAPLRQEYVKDVEL